MEEQSNPVTASDGVAASAHDGEPVAGGEAAAASSSTVEQSSVPTATVAAVDVTGDAIANSSSVTMSVLQSSCTLLVAPDWMSLHSGQWAFGGRCNVAAATS